MINIIKCSFLLLCLLAVPAFAQRQASNQPPVATTPAKSRSTAAEIETLINAKEITYAQSARFVLEASNTLATENQEEAFQYAVGQGWLPKNINAGDSARLNHICLLLMRSFNSKGGMMYSLTKSPRYAYRELTYRNILQSRKDPSMLVSGAQLLYYVNRILGSQETRVVEKKPRPEKETVTRRKALAAELNAIIKEQKIADTTVKTTDEGVMITLSNIMFEANSAELPATEMAKIREIARVLRAIPGIKILVGGHTTQAGTEAQQLDLSKARAQSVADYLVLLDACERGNVDIAGYGSRRPIADNATPQGMAANRRVEITILEN